MPPYYGENEPPSEVSVPDWLLGGNRKRRVIAALSAPPERGGWRPAELATELRCGRTTVFEVVRALRGFGALSEDGRGLVRIDPSSEMGSAIVLLLERMESLVDQAVDRPPRARDTRRGQ